MSEQLHEALSALKDGEADELEIRRLLKQGDNRDINQRWQRMHTLAEVVKGNQAAFAQWDISASVAAEIADEPVYKLSENDILSAEKTPKTWHTAFTGVAVAASVAVALVFGVQTLQNSAVQSQTDSASLASAGRAYPAQLSNRVLGGVNVDATLSSSSVQPGTGLAQAAVLGDLAAEQHLNKYMIEHTEQSAFNNGQGMINFARVASFEVE